MPLVLIVHVKLRNLKAICVVKMNNNQTKRIPNGQFMDNLMGSIINSNRKEDNFCDLLNSGVSVFLSLNYYLYNSHLLVSFSALIDNKTKPLELRDVQP